MFSLALLAACGSKDFSFSGETDNWSATLDVRQTNAGYETQDLLLEYKGEDPESVGEFSYSLDSVGGFGVNGATLNENGFVKGGSEANPTNAQATENTEVEVTVEWNGNTETFILESDG
nr:hypothetical protein [Halobacillus locisalis]